MKIFKAKKVQQVDAYTIINEPITSVDLMERASKVMANWFMDRFSNNRPVKIFVGPGNNGGDGLAIARMLADKNYQVDVCILKLAEKLKGDPAINLQRLEEQGKVKIILIEDEAALPQIGENDIILDAIFGSGLTRSLDGLPAKVVAHINNSEAIVIAVDTPSGLFGEKNSMNNYTNIIKADHTLSLQFPSLSFMYAENAECVGQFEVLPIGLHPDIINELDTPYYYIEEDDIGKKLLPRKKFAHKGNFGHALLIAGSYGKIGAAVLASRACLRTGVGLLSVHLPRKRNKIMQTAVPEAMVITDESKHLFSGAPDIAPYNAVGVGPGIGTDKLTQKAFNELLEKAEQPMVIDADAINILSEHKEWIRKVPENTILTPHPKEFERLAGNFNDGYSRNVAQVEFAKKYKLYVVLKGAYTSIACPDGTCYFNSTGNPGMATAGSGDVLTGMILSLLAQGYTPKDAAIVGVYLHGLAGDIASEQIGEEALIASDIIENIGMAYKYLRKDFNLGQLSV